MASIKPAKPGTSKAPAAAKAQKDEPAVESRRTRGIQMNTNESRQTRTGYTNTNESRQTRGTWSGGNHNISLSCI